MRLIDADEVLAYCNRLIEVEKKQKTDKMNYGQERVFQTEVIMQHIQTISPTIDARPCMLGKWINHTHKSGCGITFLDFECNVCNKHVDTCSDFCPNCGSKMLCKVDVQSR